MNERAVALGIGLGLNPRINDPQIIDLSLWKYYKVGTMNKLVAPYVKMYQDIFGYSKFSSVTAMHVVLGLPSFNTVLRLRALITD